MSGDQQASNGEKLAKVLHNLNWPTVALIALTGGGNWLQSLQNRNDLDYTREKVFRQVQDLHDGLSDFEKRQRHMLENQNAMMQNDTNVLNEIHQIVKRFDTWERSEQMRGAPP